MFLMDNRQANRDWEGSLEKVKSILTKYGAEIVRCDKWGERKLAYEIKGRRRGTYVLAYFNATGKTANEVYRECELSEMFLRAMVVKVEKIPPEELLKAPEELPVRRSSSYGDDRPAAAPAAKAAEAVEAPDAAEGDAAKTAE
jgi:ribosomal protein S6